MTDTQTQTDTFEHGIGILTGTRTDTLQSDQPVPIHGVLIPENTVLRGGQGIDHFYSPQMAQRAADVLREQVKNPDNRFHPLHLVKNFHELEGQAPADDIIGEITAVGYSPGLGVVFEGETTDLETANKIKNDYLQVSPTTARKLGALNEQMEAREVVEFAGARDVAVVGRGQPGVEVNIGPNPAVDALALDALSRAFDGVDFDTLHDTDTYQLTDEQKGLVESALDDFVESQGEATLRDLETWVFENEELDTDTRVALEAAIAELFEQFEPDPGEFRMGMFRAWLENTDTLQAIGGDDGTAQSTDGPADEQADDQRNQDTMSDGDTLTDDQKALLAAVDDPSEAIDVLQDYNSREEPEIVEKNELETLKANLDELAGVFKSALTEMKGLKEQTVDALSYEGLASEFRNDDGEITIDTLNQTPETGETETGDGGDGGDDPVDLETLSTTERDDLLRQKRKAASMRHRGMDKRAGQIEAEVCDTLGCEEYSDIKWEVL